MSTTTTAAHDDIPATKIKAQKAPEIPKRFARSLMGCSADFEEDLIKKELGKVKEKLYHLQSLLIDNKTNSAEHPAIHRQMEELRKEYLEIPKRIHLTVFNAEESTDACELSLEDRKAKRKVQLAQVQTNFNEMATRELYYTEGINWCNELISKFNFYPEYTKTVLELRKNFESDLEKLKTSTYTKDAPENLYKTAIKKIEETRPLKEYPFPLDEFPLPTFNPNDAGIPSMYEISQRIDWVISRFDYIKTKGYSEKLQYLLREEFQSDYRKLKSGEFNNNTIDQLNEKYERFITEYNNKNPNEISQNPFLEEGQSSGVQKIKKPSIFSRIYTWTKTKLFGKPEELFPASKLSQIDPKTIENPRLAATHKLFTDMERIAIEEAKAGNSALYNQLQKVRSQIMEVHSRAGISEQYLASRDGNSTDPLAASKMKQNASDVLYNRNQYSELNARARSILSQIEQHQLNINHYNADWAEAKEVYNYGIKKKIT